MIFEPKQFFRNIGKLIQTYPYKSATMIAISVGFGYVVRWIFE